MDNITDKEIKALFQNREITPNFDSWDKLENLLEDTKVKPMFEWKKWMSIAASILVVGLMIWLVIPQKTDIVPDIVEADTTIQTPFSEEDIIVATDTKEEETSAMESNETKKSEIFTPIEVATNNTSIDNQKNEKIVPYDYRKSMPNEYIKTEEFDDENIEKVWVASETNTEDKNMAEAESLLNLAHEKIKIERRQEIKRKHKIHPERLLAEAEKKSQETFLSKLQKNVQATSEQVIVAVINRIYE